MTQEIDIGKYHQLALQKQKEHELDLLYNMTMYIDCQNMADICKENLEEMEKIDLTETMKISA